jgi:hypothetical protein
VRAGVPATNEACVPWIVAVIGTAALLSPVSTALLTTVLTFVLKAALSPSIVYATPESPGALTISIAAALESKAVIAAASKVTFAALVMDVAERLSRVSLTVYMDDEFEYCVYSRWYRSSCS